VALRTTHKSVRRRPKQRRARQTVDAVLDAVVRVLKREGVQGVTTNRIAEVAGVSIGSVYQYFPDKQAIFVALHQRHIDQVPHRADATRDFAVRLHGAFRLALSARANELNKGRDLDKLTFVVTNMVESLSHGALFRRPPGLSLAVAKAEVVRAVLAYLHS